MISFRVDDLRTYEVGKSAMRLTRKPSAIVTLMGTAAATAIVAGGVLLLVRGNRSASDYLCSTNPRKATSSWKEWISTRMDRAIPNRL